MDEGEAVGDWRRGAADDDRDGEAGTTSDGNGAEANRNEDGEEVRKREAGDVVTDDA